MGAPKGNQYAKGNKGGRPTKYKGKRTVQFVEDYIASHNIPWIEDVLLELDVSESTVFEWEQRHVEFSKTMDRLRQKQKGALMKMGLKKKVDSRFARFLLSANHDVIEKTERKNQSEVDLKVTDIDLSRLDNEELEQYERLASKITSS